MPETALVLGDALYDGLPGLPSRAPVLMIEDLGLCTRVRHHRRKIVLFLAAMRTFRDRLRAEGRQVRYFELPESDGMPFFARVAREAPDGVVLHAPSDRFFLDDLAASGIAYRMVDAPKFLTPRAFWDRFRSGRRRLLMGDFYTEQRRRMDLLLEGGKPRGGRWSFDAENRRPLPADTFVPPEPVSRSSEIVREVVALVDRTFPDHPGCAEGFGYPVSHEGAAAWLEEFLEDRLDEFGPYEDALSTAHRVGFHSLLTPMLNCGLLTPAQVVEAALRRDAVRPVPVASLEGFLRQIVGWREFVKLVDEDYPDDVHTSNPLGHHRRLAPCWWTGETGLPPVDLAIRRTLEHGWCHHIERLMVLSSPMLMAGVRPDEAYRWFMEMFVDSADWVMRPNVFGMGQHADGGVFATKPYVSGSAYVRKMGDFPAGPWCDVWDGLYWGFVNRHREWLARNARMGPAVGTFDRMDPVRRDRVLGAAREWIGRVTVEDGTPPSP